MTILPIEVEIGQRREIAGGRGEDVPLVPLLEMRGSLVDSFFGLLQGLALQASEQVRSLFKFLDSMVVLPRELEKALSLDLAEFERGRAMPYVSSIERIAREEGEIEGKAKAKVETKVEVLLRLLTKRFHAATPAELEARIRATADLAKLDARIDMGLEAADLADFRRMAGI